MNRAEFVNCQNDTVVYPSISSQFGEIGENGKHIYVRETDIYKDDKIGLKTLDNENKLYFRTMPNKNHLEYDNLFFF